MWSLDDVTDAERRVMAKMLFGATAPVKRQKGGELILAAVAQGTTAEVEKVRTIMAGAPSNFAPPAELSDTLCAWRAVQVRQLFRLALEATLFWIVRKVEDGPRSTDYLVDAFLDEAEPEIRPRTASEWLRRPSLAAIGPVSLIERIEKAFEPILLANLVPAIVDGIAFCLMQAPPTGHEFERHDRLPLIRARREAEAWGQASPRAFVRHLLETWVLAQHVYWSVGRGLADARSRGKTILRLKVVLEEGGWVLAPGVIRGAAPVRTPDRLQTALSLATECGLIDPLLDATRPRR
jgi:hypothetical protein